MAATPSTPKKPAYGLIQIEPTSRCNLRCMTCLRASHPELWQERNLPSEVFSNLKDVLRRTKAVHLQGWGEPLLLDNFDFFIKTAKQSGCRTSFTTNGSIMDEQLAQRLVQSDVDGVTFSMAGASAEIQDQLRGKNSFQRLDNSLSILARVKKKLHSSTPAIAVSYLLTPATVSELPLAVKWCGKRGVQLFAGVHLTHAANDEQQDLQLFLQKNHRFRSQIRRANLWAVISRLRLELPPLAPALTAVCDKDPIHNLSIGADGSVAPCVFLNAPTSKPVHWRNVNNHNQINSTPFHVGNILEEPLDRIWNRKSYRDFRKCFSRRKEIFQQALARVGYDMDGIEQLEEAREVIGRAFDRNPVPEPCAGCTKLMGY